MDTLHYSKESIANEGFAIIENIFTDEEVDNLLHTISLADTNKPNFRKTVDLFAIRQFFKEIPQTIELILTKGLAQ